MLKAEQLFPDELEKFNGIEGAYSSRDSNASVKYLFKNALSFANLAVQTLPESTAKVSFLIYMKTWELLDQQAQLDDTLQAILRGLTGIGDIVDIAGQASSAMLASAMNRSKESIQGILTLLEDVSVYIFNQLATNDLAPVRPEDEGINDSFDVEAYLERLKGLQTAFHASWSPMATTPVDPNDTVEDGLLDTPQQGANESLRVIDSYDMLRLLLPLDPNSYNPRQACMDGTREVILSRIVTWTQNRDSAEGLMWISGQAGIGKTSVATSLCQRLDSMRALAGSFFCQRGSLDTSNPLRLINNLVHEIAMQCPAYAQEVAHAIRANRRLSSDYDATSNIRAYIESQVAELAEKEHWPSDSIDQLCTLSGGVFLWATLAVKYIKKSAFPALPRLRKVMSKQKSPMTDHFDALYTKALKMAIDDEEDDIKGAYLRCIGAILVISECAPLAASAFKNLLLSAGRIDQLTLEQMINNLRALLLITDEQRIQFHHVSFRDFVTDAPRAGQFHIRLDQYEAELAACCLQVMQRDLCFNICELETSHQLNSEIPDLKQRIDTYIGSALRYACMHWIDHFVASPTQALVAAVKKLMEGPQLIYWIEALSLLDRIDVAIEGLSKLMAVDLTHLSDSGLLASWANDARRFIFSFYDPITTSTPHLYVSALAFAPRHCLIAVRLPDPPGSPTNHERFRQWITDVEVTPGSTEPNCKFSARIFVDEELVCDLPAIDSTRPLRWSGLLYCNVLPTSAISLRLCKSIAGRPRYFNFKPFMVSELDEETGEVTLELRDAAWVVTIKCLTQAIAEQLFPDELGKLDTINGVYNSLDPNATVKYLFVNALKFGSLVAQAFPDGRAKIIFLIYMKTWELLDQQTELDDTVQAILSSLTGIGDIVDIVGQVSSAVLPIAMGRSKASIEGLLALLEDASVYIYNQLATNDLAPASLENADLNDAFNVETYLNRLKELQTAFHASWSPVAATPVNLVDVQDDQLFDTPQGGTHGSTAIDPYDMLRLLRPLDPNGYNPRQACMDGTREVILTRIEWERPRSRHLSVKGLDGMRALAGSFFCQRDNLDTSDPLRLINNLVHEIAMTCPAYAQEVAHATRANRRLCNSHLDVRYDGLIKKPLERLRSLSMRMNLVIVIDALDECGDCESREQILGHLHEMSQLVPWLKVIITARPVGNIQDYFAQKCPHEPIIQLQDYDATSNIRAYIEGQVAQLAEQEHWPSDNIDELCTMSGGVFLWATLAVKYIKKSAFPALPRLRKVLSKQKSPVTDHFDALYRKTLEMAIDDEEDDIKAAYLRCIGAILAISERGPLAAPDLQYLLLVAGQMDQLNLQQTIKNLGPLLIMTDGQRIRFSHPSFKEFVTNAARSAQFHIRMDQYEAEPAACCLQVMQRDLRFNICQLETSHQLNSEITDLKQRIDTHIGPALRYAYSLQRLGSHIMG
ncbi:vegetative incompatibility protein HET-E-1, putative, partial [Rhizoctonia solani AG-3 Rhs1AP]